MKILNIIGLRFTMVWCLKFCLFASLLIFTGCNKLVEIDPPVNTITTKQVFADDANAIAGVTGIYSKLAGKSEQFSLLNGGTAIVTGLSSDELVTRFSAPLYSVIYRNELVERGPQTTLDQLWRRAYESIYPINACLENLSNSSGISASIKVKLIAEVKFLRALIYFNLINLFGDVPFVETTEWDESRLTFRKTKSEIYEVLINDLLQAKESLPNDYTLYNNERVRATKWAAEALLARLYLYTDKWAQAENSAANVINSSLFALPANLNDVFLKNSKEAILQWHNSSGTFSLTLNLTPEGASFIPQINQPPNYYFSDQQLNAFEDSDRRKLEWIKTVIYANKPFSFPFKYKKGEPDLLANGPVTEYSMVLRLAELYLIRAEARAKLNNTTGAATDLNAIRKRAALQDSPATTKEQLLLAIEHERQVELFAESGHRWFDLKRTGRVDAVMSVVTPQKSNGGAWKSYQQIYPIPYGDRVYNPNLTQNEGY